MRSLALLCSLLISPTALAAGATPSPATTRSVPASAPASSSASPPAASASASAPAEQAQTQEEKPEEQSEPPTLESRIPPVSAKAFSIGRKIEITPGLGLSLNDAFLEKFIPELSAGYHINEYFYVGVRGGYAFDVNAGHVNACSSPPNVTCGSPTSQQVSQLPGSFTALVDGQFAWTPLYGKVNLFGEKVIHFDTSVVLGVGVLLYSPAAPDATTPQSVSAAPEFSPGLAERFFFTQNLALLAELRDTLYVASGLQSQMMFHLGLTILL